MILHIKLIIFICTALGFGESKFVDNLPTCNIKDNECLGHLYEFIVREAGPKGIPEIGIPPLEPLVLKNVSASVLDLVNLTMVNGVAKGISGCKFNKFEIDLDRYIGTQEVTCDLTIKGQYLLSSNLPVLTTLLGDGSIHGNGHGRVKIQKVFTTWNFTFYPERHDDGEIYIKCLYKDIKYNSEIQGKISFEADSIYIGNENISKFVVNYMNENWKFVMGTFGQTFIDKAMSIYFSFAKKFFEGIPTKLYIIEDLTPYVRTGL